MTPEQYAKLPLYARMEIDRLKANVTHYRQMLHEVRDDETPQIYWGSKELLQVGIPTREVVTFIIPGDEKIEVSRGFGDRGVLHVRSYHNRLIVQPTSSNAIDVWAIQ